MRFSAWFLVLIVMVLPATALAQPIIGDPVPNLGADVEWVLGSGTPAFERGKVYLLDFWATWCPPCYPMIDTLSELSRRHRAQGLVVVGIAVGTDVGTPLAAFLERESERIDYRIAVPQDEEGLKRRLFHPAFVDPENFSLPILLIVDRAGRLAWLSDPAHPEQGLEEALEAVLDGTFDTDGAAVEARSRLGSIAAQKTELERARSLRAEGHRSEAAKLFLDLATNEPAVFGAESVDLFVEMLCHGEEVSAYAYGRHLSTQALSLQVPELARMERAILFIPASDRRDYELAERLARQALGVRGGDHPDFLYELAKLYHLKGDTAKAREFQRLAATRASEQGWDQQYQYVIGQMSLAAVIGQQSARFRKECKSGDSF